MARIFIPSGGPDSWRPLLAQPEVHWRPGYSARTLAHCWEASTGFPAEVAAVLVDVFGPVELVLAIPELQTPLPGGTRPSQSDVFALARHAGGLVACTIEGKVDEPFGPTVGDWLRAASPGKTERLAYLCALLGLATCPPDVHYQLLHRTAAALIEAERFAAADAAMIVHSFSRDRRWFAAFERFCAVLGGSAVGGRATMVATPSGRRLALGWASGDHKFLSA